MIQTAVPIRVRYVDCDPMGFVHHSVYPVWFEVARTELLRQQAGSYRQMEEDGMRIVVARLEVRYRQPGRYDDELDVHVQCTASGGAKIEHAYEVRRGNELLCTGTTTLACLGSDGRPIRVPDFLKLP